MSSSLHANRTGDRRRWSPVVDFGAVTVTGHDMICRNQWPQYRAGCRRSDHLFGERIHFISSLVAKTALVWQVYAHVPVD